MDYRLDPPDDPQSWCDVHNCALIEDADEDGRCDYCPECAADSARTERLGQLAESIVELLSELPDDDEGCLGSKRDQAARDFCLQLLRKLEVYDYCGCPLCLS